VLHPFPRHEILTTCPRFHSLVAPFL
jgi:hypothetical protein